MHLLTPVSVWLTDLNFTAEVSTFSILMADKSMLSFSKMSSPCGPYHNISASYGDFMSLVAAQVSISSWPSTMFISVVGEVMDGGPIN